MDGMTRGEVADKAGVNPETLRYYERNDLIPTPPRFDGGFRLYDDSYVKRLQFIKRAKELGFTLAEIKTCWTCALTTRPPAATYKRGRRKN